MTKISKFIGLAVFCYGLHTAITFAELKTQNNELNQHSYAKPILPDKLKEDLDFLFKTIEEVHPNMYAYTSKEQFTRLRDKLYQQINRPMSRLEFYELVVPVVASLKSGHTYIQPFQEEFKQFLKNGGTVFPLALRLDGSKAILAKNYTSTRLPIGGTVLTINGQEATEIFARFARWFPAENRTTNPDVVQQRGIFGWLLRLKFGPVESWTLQIKATEGSVNSYTVKPVPLAKIMAAPAGTNDDKQQNYYKYIPEHRTALLEINSFGSDLRKFRKFLKENFQEIHDHKVPNLIIDIRENPGGSDTNANALLEYLTAKPYKQFQEARIKLSSQGEEGIAPLRRQNPELFENKKEGDIITIELPLRTPADNPLRFTGQIFVLIGPRSFSTSTSFAAAMKHFGIGTLVGEETGDPTILYGNIIRVPLPNSGLVAAIAARAFVLAGGKPNGRGVLPDYLAKQTPEDTAKGVDTVLQFTLDLIKKSNSKISTDQEKDNTVQN